MPLFRDERLTEALENLVEVQQLQLEWFKSHLNAVTKQDLKKAVEEIMSAISDYNTKIEAHLTTIGTGVDGLAVDVSELKRIIEQLQNNPGPISPEDQALLDASEAKLAAIAAKVKALDELTPPPPPPTP